MNNKHTTYASTKKILCYLVSVSNNYISGFLWNAFTHPCPNFIQATEELGAGNYTQLFHALIPMLIKLIFVIKEAPGLSSNQPYGMRDVMII